MSIVEEIIRIKNNIGNAYSKLEEMGATIPIVKNSANLVETISSLPKESSGDISGIINGTITNVTGSTLGGVDSIRDNAFSGLNIESVEVPNNVTTIGVGAFSNNNISTLTLKDGVTTIGDSAFENNAIQTLTIPASVTTIGDSAFAGNDLTEITMESDIPPVVTDTTFPSSLTTTNVTYNGYPNYESDANWQIYKDTLVRGLAIPSTITITVNNYLGELVNGAEVTISGNGQTFTGITNEQGVFAQGDLQPATYTIIVADIEGFKTPSEQSVEVYEDTQNNVEFTYLEKPQGIEFDRVFGNNSPAIISAVSAEISANNMTSAEVEATYGWKLGDTISYQLTTGENVEMRIIGFNHDDKSDGSGKAGITLQMTHCLNTFYRMGNKSRWRDSIIRNTTLPNVMSTMPQGWQDIIVQVNKRSVDVITIDTLFLLSEMELTGKYKNSYGGINEGSQYEYWVGKSTQSRILLYDKNSDNIPETPADWVLRSQYKTEADTTNTCINSSGGIEGFDIYSNNGISYACCV